MSSISDGNFGPSAGSLYNTTTERGVTTGLPPVDLSANDVESEVNALMREAGFEIVDGQLVVNDVAAAKAADIRLPPGKVLGVGSLSIQPPMPPQVKLDEEMRVGAETFANNMDLVFNDALGRPRMVNGVPETFQRQMNELSPDIMLAAFLKLNITDPNNSVETRNDLYNIATQMRQKAITESRARIARAHEAMEKAERYAEVAKVVGVVVTVVTIIISVALIVASLGTATPVVAAGGAAAIAGTAAATAGATSAAAAASSAAASTAAQAAVQAAVQTANQVAVQAAEAAVQQLAERGVTHITQQMIQQMAQEMGRQMAQQMAKQMTEQLTQQVGKEAAQQIMKQVTQEMMQQFARQFSQQFTRQFAQQWAQQTGQQLSQKVLQEAMRQGFEKTFTKTFVSIARHGSLGVLKSQATSVLSRMTGPMTRLKAIGIGTSVTLEVFSAGTQLTSAQQSLDAQEAQLHVERMRMLQEWHQQQIEDQNEMVNMIMESKNKTVDSVLRMINALFASRQQLMSAAMAK